MGDQYDFNSKEEIVQSFVVKKDGRVYSDGREIKVATQGEPGKTPQKGIDYFDGADGIGRPPAYEVLGTTIRFENPDGTWGPYIDLKGKPGNNGITPKKGIDYFDGEPGKTPEKGVDYKDGKDGVTPVKGIDYKNGEPGKPGVEPEEMTQIRSTLDLMKNAIKEMKDDIGIMTKIVACVKNGDPGYTPKKGKDYDDGKDGYTPVKGVDYKDGEDAKIPESVTMTVITAVDFDKKSFKQQAVKFYL